MNPKFFIGAMSKNVIDACIEWVDAAPERTLGLIPSRRQVDWNIGYTGFGTRAFVEYVKDRSSRIVIERDHGGPHQGKQQDDGRISLKNDIFAGIDILHIDPWKFDQNDAAGLQNTIELIDYCLQANPHQMFEVGTEEAIKHFTTNKLDRFLGGLFEHFGSLAMVKYAVIQSGTRLERCTAAGKFNPARSEAMVKIVEMYGLTPKEHNSDYIPLGDIKKRRDQGLVHNIAPEFATIESRHLMSKMDKSQIHRFYELVLAEGSYQKWVSQAFAVNKELVISAAGHYVQTNIKFQDLKHELNPDIDKEIRALIKKKLDELHS